MEHDFKDIRGLIFDYGGTLDTGGDHWAAVLLDQYRLAGADLSFSQFAPAYIDAERRLEAEYLIHPDFTFLDTMQIKTALQTERLVADGVLKPELADETAHTVALGCYESARRHIDRARPLLEALACRYPMVLVSNFYGNIAAVLRDFGLRDLFKGIVESETIGLRKPDPHIFAIGCTVLGLDPSQVLVTGDSISKDIIPARSLGCRTAWIQGRPWPGDSTAGAGLPDAEPTTLSALATALLAG